MKGTINPPTGYEEDPEAPKSGQVPVIHVVGVGAYRQHNGMIVVALDGRLHDGTLVAIPVDDEDVAALVELLRYRREQMS